MSISTNAIQFTTPCISIGSTSLHIYAYDTMFIDAPSLEINAQLSSAEYAQLSSGTYLKDAAGTVLVDKGVWQIAGSGGDNPHKGDCLGIYVNYLDIKANEILLANKEYTGAAKLSTFANLTDANNTAIITNGVFVGGGSFEDTGHILGGNVNNRDATATGANAQAIEYYATATGYTAQATGTSATATGYNAQATAQYATATGYTAKATGGFATATGVGARANGYYAIATGSSAQAKEDYAIATGESAEAASDATATGRRAQATCYGSFAYGAYAQTDKAGEGVLRVCTENAVANTYATSLKLVGAGSEVSNGQLGGACGLGYKEKTADYRYARLKDIFDLAEKASELLALLSK